MSETPEEYAARKERLILGAKQFLRGGGVVSTTEWFDDMGDTTREAFQIASAELDVERTRAIASVVAAEIKAGLDEYKVKTVMDAMEKKMRGGE